SIEDLVVTTQNTPTGIITMPAVMPTASSGWTPWLSRKACNGSQTSGTHFPVIRSRKPTSTIRPPTPLRTPTAAAASLRFFFFRPPLWAWPPAGGSSSAVLRLLGAGASSSAACAGLPLLGAGGASGSRLGLASRGGPLDG